MNSDNEYILDVDELYEIVNKLKSSKDDAISYSNIISKNPSSSMRERYTNSKKEYYKALTDFNYFIKNYIRINEKEEN